MRMSVHKQTTAGLCTSLLILTVLVLVDYFSLGFFLFSPPAAHNSDLMALSGAAFLAATYAAQIVYAVTSSIRTGVAASIVFEAKFATHAIAAACQRALTDLGLSRREDLLANVYLCMATGTLLFAFLSLLPCLLGLSNILRDMPLIAVFGTMAAIGLQLVIDSAEEYAAAATTEQCVLLGVVLLGALAMLIVEIRFPDFPFVIPSAAVVVVAGFNLVYRGFYGLSAAELRTAGHIVDLGKGGAGVIWEVPQLVMAGRLSFRCLARCAGPIALMALLNVIHLGINVPPYAFAAGAAVDYGREWRTQALANVASALCGYPTYFVGSTSMLFFRVGARSRLASVLGSLVPAVLAFGAGSVQDYVPGLLSGVVLGYIGLSFLYGYYLGVLASVSASDAVAITLVGATAFFFAPGAGFLLGLILAAAVAFRHHQEMGSAGGKAVAPSDYVAAPIRVDYVLCFATLQRLVEAVERAGSEITIDLTGCPYVDMTANLYLQRLASVRKRLRVVGKPHNLYTWALLKESNVHLIDA